MREKTQKQLKTQVFKNYAEFITISKEIAILENDMLDLKELLSEWKQLPQALQLDDPINNTRNGLSDLVARGSSRNSMVDLEHIYRAQIASLWENVEGSQKFVPQAYGRHLIAETSQFVELNAATYKPKQAVSLFLLDDLLLVAVQKKRHYGSRVHLVADRCFSLSDIVVVDLKDSRDVSSAVKIKRGKEVYVYRTEKTQDKRALLHAFRRVGEDLANKKKRERNSQAEPSGAQADAAQSEVDIESSGALLSTDAGVQRANAQDVQTLAPWFDSLIDDLAVHIALRQWEEAVGLVEQGKSRARARD